MNEREFREVLEGAVAGAGVHEDLEELLRLYMPMINKYNVRNGQMDEDLRQYIMIHVALNISKFGM